MSVSALQPRRRLCYPYSNKQLNPQLNWHPQWILLYRATTDLPWKRRRQKIEYNRRMSLWCSKMRGTKQGLDRAIKICQSNYLIYSFQRGYLFTAIDTLLFSYRFEV